MFTLRAKVGVLTAAVVVAASVASTTLAVVAQEQHIRQELLARGVALSEALARSAADGLAAEDLNLLKSAQDIVAANDVLLAQVFSTLWLGVASVPASRLNDRPEPEAVEFFASHTSFDQDYAFAADRWIDVYHTVVLDSHDPRIPRLLIGYVRLRLSTGGIDALTRRTVLASVGAAALLTLAAVVVLNVFIGRYVLKPIVRLQSAVSSHREGEFPDSVPVEGRDEVGELSAEFNRMVAALREREARLSEEKERLAVTLRSIADAVVVTDLEGRITLFNRVAELHTGWSAGEALGRPIAEVMPLSHERTREPIENPAYAALATGGHASLATPACLARKDGVEILIEDSAAAIRDRASLTVGAVLVFRDVTEKRRLELEVIKSEKLQSLGVLAGGLAHDFNNLLTAVLGHVSMARLEVAADTAAHGSLVEAEAATQRATGLTRQLLTFARGGAPIRKTASVSAIARESIAFTLSGSSVAARFREPADAWPADVDEGQIGQVFNNLALNAMQAMPTGGTVTVAVENVVLSEREVAPLAAGPYVKVSVTDTGVGIPDDQMPRIFDPYFTTKQHGSGLGLSSVYSIVGRHDGHITVSSRPGHGTTFTLYLPARPGSAVVQPRPAPSAASGHGRVLVMDDEESVRKVSLAILRRLGYHVEVAADGAQAVDRYARALDEGRRFDAVVMDLTVPGGMGGREAIDHLRRLDPGVVAIVSSGYSHDPVMADHAAHGFRGVISKPYTIEGFSRALQAAMAPPPPIGGPDPARPRS